MASAACQSAFAAYVPNGCDCFGCCDVPGIGWRYLGTDCQPELVTGCASCTPAADCLNPCEACETCFDGRPASGCSGPRCAGVHAGATACGRPGDAPCPAAQWCLTGCCVPTME
jgi:hypothetical protein